MQLDVWVSTHYYHIFYFLPALKITEDIALQNKPQFLAPSAVHIKPSAHINPEVKRSKVGVPEPADRYDAPFFYDCWWQCYTVAFIVFIEQCRKGCYDGVIVVCVC